MIAGFGFPVALQFKADGRGGYLYRKDQTGPAVAATASERDRFVGRMGWMVVAGTLLYFAGIVLMAVVADRLLGSDGGSIGVFGAMAMGIVALGGLYLFMRWASHAPARAFAGRPEVAPAQSLKAVFGGRVARFSYTRIVVVSAGLAAFMLVGSRDHPEAWWLAVGLPAAIGAGYAIWKWRIERA